MAVTIRDVAAAAGVSIATVSRALRGHSNISARTTERVTAVATELGYRLPARAEADAQTATQRVAIVAPFIGRWYFAKIIERIEWICREHGLESLLFRPADSTGAELDWVEHLRHFGVQGAVIITHPISEEELERLTALELPVVLIGAPRQGLSTIGIDDVAVGELATNHLLELGHRRIAIVTGFQNDPLKFRTPVDRLRGYRTALLTAGITPEPELEIHADFTAPSSFQAVLQVLARIDPPTAVFAASDEMALGVIGAARQLGLRVPEDLSVIGVDDHEIAAPLGLTTIAQPVDAIAEYAAWQLISSLNQDSRGVPARVLLPFHLEARETTGPPQAAQGAE